MDACNAYPAIGIGSLIGTFVPIGANCNTSKRAAGYTAPLSGQKASISLHMAIWYSKRDLDSDQTRRV